MISINLVEEEGNITDRVAARQPGAWAPNGKWEDAESIFPRLPIITI
jgi:hypothetical protein